MNECDKLVHLFLTLPDEYDTVITPLETLTFEKELTIELVKSMLMDEEFKFKQRYDPNDDATECGKEGHVSYQCTNTNKPGSGNG